MPKFARRNLLNALLLLVSVLSVNHLSAQTFRGGIAGTVQDPSGASIPNAKITLLEQQTGLIRETTATSNGTYAFQDLPLGQYTITIQASGFSQSIIKNITTRPGEVYSLSPKLGLAGSSTNLDVNANALSLDTENSTNTAVVGDKAVANVPLNGRDFRTLLNIVPGYNGAGSLNGTRTNQNNYQIDGADNNDIWQNGAAANQGGVGSIAGVTIPIDAIDQFSVQSQGNAEIGRNGGGLVSMAIKSGTNQIHGSAYYFNRNEFFAARSPFLPTSTRKGALRNQQFGGSFGGPIVKNHLFYFVNYERQMYTIQNSSLAVEPTAPYIAAATNLLAAHGIPVSQLSKNLLVLWPNANGTGAANSAGNYYDPTPQHGYSDNAIGKIDWQISDRQSLSVRAFIGTGRQFAAVGTNVYDYYQLAPDITQNFTAAHNFVVTPHISNQLVAGVGVFNQTFNDANHSFDLPALGLADGVTNPALFGAPTITISGGLDVTGETQPLGRKDYTGHLTDTATWVFGKHQFRFGGEFRRNYMDLQYQRNVRGTFTFNGTASASVALPTGATPYSADSTYGGSDVRSLADYLAGYVASSTFTQGYLRRNIYENTYALFASDAFNVTNKLTLNYGLRYEYNAPFNSDGVLSDFRPGNAQADGYGLVQPGKGIDKIYPGNFSNFAPRFGFAYQAAPKLAIRGTYGIFFDAINFNGFFDNRPGNGAAAGVQANPTGTTPVQTLTSTFYGWQLNQNPFAGATTPAVLGLATVAPNFRTAYIQNTNLNLEYQIGKNTIAQIGYVGSEGRRLFQLVDINQAVAVAVATSTLPVGTTATANVQLRRPYYNATNIAQAPKIAAINQIQSEGTSNYNGLVASIRTSNFHGLSAQASWTYGHALDVVSGTRGFAPQNSYNTAGEYGNSDFDTRNTASGYVVYELPKFTTVAPRLTQGWQVNSFVSAYTGTPFSVKSGVDNSHTGENQDRANQVASPTAGITRSLVRSGASATPYYVWDNPTSWVQNTANTFGTSARNAYRGPAFATVDAALVKNTPIYDRVNFQLRAELFNIFNRINLANPNVSLSSSSFGRISSTRNGSGAPGIGSGEPFNVQFAGKIIF